jgi:hypothetical protein
VSRTPAAEFAWVKVAFPGWSIRRVQPGKGVGFTARRRPGSSGARLVYSPTLAGLVHLLRLSESSSERS